LKIWLRGKDLNLRPLGYEDSPTAGSSRENPKRRGFIGSRCCQFSAGVGAVGSDLAATAEPPLSQVFSRERARARESGVQRMVPSGLAVAAEHVLAVTVENALFVESLFQPEARPMNPDLRCRQGRTADLRGLHGGQALQIVEDESRPVLLGQAVDHQPHAGVHLVDDELLLDRVVKHRQVRRFAQVHDLCSVGRLAKMVGGNAGRDRKRPRLEFRPTFEPWEAARDPNQRLLEKVLGQVTVADVSAEIAQDRTRQLLEDLFEGT
jgi:hypothetical protein